MVTVLERIDPRQKKELECLDYARRMFESSDGEGRNAFGFLISLYAACAEDPEVRSKAKEYVDRNKIPHWPHEEKCPVILDTKIAYFNGKLHWEANVNI